MAGTSTTNGAGATAAKEASTTTTAPGRAAPVTQKVLSVSANLVQLLPTGSVLAYQVLAPSFSNQGNCYTSNWWLTLGLVAVLTASCVFFAFTDTLVHNGKVYYGVASPGRLNVINLSKEDEDKIPRERVKKMGLKKKDFVHAALSAVMFLTMAFSDVGLQQCFFPHAGTDTQQLLKNLPLGMAIFSSLVFTIFPTKRNFIGSNDPNTARGGEDEAEFGGAAASSKLPVHAGETGSA